MSEMWICDKDMHCIDCPRNDPNKTCEHWIEVAPVKHGRWVYKKVGGWKCSECGVQAPFWCFATTQNLSNYCHNCGAKMDEVEK